VAGGGGWPGSGGGRTVGSSPMRRSTLICSAGPALRLPGEGEPRFLALLTGGGRRGVLFAPDLTLHRLQPQVVSGCCARSWKRRLQQRSLTCSKEAGVPWQRHADAGRDPARTAQLSSGWLAGCCAYHPAPSGIWCAEFTTPSYCLVGAARYSVHSVAPPGG